MKLFEKRFAEIEPVIKLSPIMKLTGNCTVSPIIRFTFLLLELFCIPTIKINNKEELNKTI